MMSNPPIDPAKFLLTKKEVLPGWSFGWGGRRADDIWVAVQPGWEPMNARFVSRELLWSDYEGPEG